MSRDALDYLEDILENALAACEFARDLSCEAFVADRKTLYAVMRALEIIGEAAKRVPEDMRGRHPDIDWRGMAGLRDVIIHQYDRIDPSVPFHIATAQLPAMIDRLRALIAEEHRLAGEADG